MSAGQPNTGTMTPSGFFIVGAPRTGSTLFRRILNAHSQVAIPPESPFLIDYLMADHVPAARRLALLIADPEYRAWPHGVAAQLQATDVPAGIEEIHASYAAAVGKTRWGQKTPRLVRLWHTLAEAFPDARFIHVVRDPRAVAASLRKSAAHRSHALAAARRWRLDTGMGLAMERAIPSRALQVRYEELVCQPEATIRRVCAFLELPFEPAMLLPETELRLNPQEVSRGHHEKVDQPITADSLETWRTSLSPRDVATVSAVVADVSRSCGYQVDPAALPGLWQRAIWAMDGQATALLKLVSDARQRPLWPVCRRRWQLGTFWSTATDFLSGR